MALAPVYCGVSISSLCLSGDQLQGSSSVSLPSRRGGISLKTSSKGARGAFAASNMGQYTSSEETNDSVMELLKNSSDPLFSFSAGAAATADTQKGNLADKFKMLRQKLRDLDTHHDTMYHSSIASRLAMDRS